MLVVAILGILATISVNEFGGQLMRAKRTEAIVGLGALWTAQQAHYLEHGTYAGNFIELREFDIGGERLSATSYRGRRYTYQLSQPWGEASFYCIATADLDGDPWPDILEIYEFGE
jgi:Tfp pilus assembly protein PilE